MTQDELFKTLVAHCKEYGFIFPSSEIYDGLAAVYDYGQMGVELKNNIKRYWWEAMVRLHENIVGLDSCIFMHPKIWEASGHVGAFNDPLIDNKDSKKRYRADVLIEDYIAKLEEKIRKEVEKGRKKFGDGFDETKFLETNPNVLRNKAKIEEVRKRMADALNANDLAELRQIIIDCEIVCPISGTKNWTEVRQFNLMFSTQLGNTSDDTNVIYLRPETAQGIFVNYLNVQKTGRMKIPFGIAQIGKAFRNEIVARQFIFRMREFEQMEMQFFLHTMQMPLQTSNSTSRSASRNWKAYIQGLILTSGTIRSSQGRKSSTLTLKAGKVILHTSSRLQSEWTGWCLLCFPIH